MGTFEDIVDRTREAIPDYSGYHAKEYINDSDRLLRHNLASELEKCRLYLDRLRDNLSHEGKLSGLGEVEDLILKVDNQEKNFRKSSYEVNEEEIEKLSEEMLETLYEYDLSLLDRIESLKCPIDKLEEYKNSPELFDQEIAFINEELERIEEQYKMRGNIS